MFSTFFTFLTTTVADCIATLSDVYTFVAETPLEEFSTEQLPVIAKPLAELFLDYASKLCGADVTLFELIFGVALPVVILLSLAKWVIGIFT